MKTDTLIKKLKLTDSSFARIKEAVAQAEQHTSGEIALALTYESDTYAFYELFAALTVGSLVFAVLLPFAQPLEQLLDSLFWQPSPVYLPLFLWMSCFGVIIACYCIFNIEPIDRRIVPRSAQYRAVWNRSLRCFTESGVYHTERHSGILIFVSYLERQVRIVADNGISKKISTDLWNLIAGELAAGISEGRAEDSFVQAVRRCGELLAEHFPAHKENPNELADGLVVLED